MPRPGFVLEVDEKTPPLLTMAGASVKLERFGPGTRVAYPADAVPSSDPVPLIDAALESPVVGQPLAERLAPDVRLTIVVTDNSRPQPRMRFDVRRTMVERVLELAARNKVDDVQVVIATGLNRRWSDRDITEVLGDRVATSFLADNLITSHDVTSDDLVSIGEVGGHEVRMNARVASSDLVVSIGVRDDHAEGHPFTLGLTDVDTINRIAGFGAAPSATEDVAALISAQIPTFAVVAVLGQPRMHPSLSFLNRREWEWRFTDHLAYAAARQFVAALPKQGAQKLYAAPRADYVVLDMVGGEPEAVHAEAREVWRAAHLVDLGRQADVLVASVWGSAFDVGNPVGSPIRAAHNALVEQAGCHLGQPLVRDQGVVVALHPLVQNFSNRTQSASADFFVNVLPQTLDPFEIHERFEAAAAVDPWYLNLYKERFAHHPLGVFHTWYRLREATQGLADVIWVGADRRTAAMMGHRAASTLTDAYEIAAAVVGHRPEITHLHGPGRVLGSVS
ncbi:MAG: lactate racemase domain-containing protein [Propionibacteriaceae bacterium]|nr:lactate racemase domain-containing protein [Propionibacteriaceae bacterium]